MINKRRQFITLSLEKRSVALFLFSIVGGFLLSSCALVKLPGQALETVGKVVTTTGKVVETTGKVVESASGVAQSAVKAAGETEAIKVE